MSKLTRRLTLPVTFNLRNLSFEPTSKTLAGGGGGSPYLPMSDALFAAWTGSYGPQANPPSIGHKNITDVFIRALTEADIFSNLDAFGDSNVHGRTASLVNWLNPGTNDLTTEGDITFGAFNLGLKSGGVNGIVRTGYIPSEHPEGNFQRNNHSVLVGASVPDEGDGPIAGTLPNQSHYLYADYENVAYAFNGGGPITSPNTDGTKLIATDRTAANSHRMILEGSQVATGSHPSVEPDFEITFLSGIDGGQQFYSKAGLGPWWYGSSMSNAQYEAMRDAYTTYSNAKKTMDYIYYLGTSYFGDNTYGAALPIDIDKKLTSSSGPSLMSVKGGGISSRSQLTYYRDTVRKSFRPGRNNILVLMPGDSDKADGSDGEVTVGAMIVNLQTLCTEAKADGYTVVVCVTPAWAYSSTAYTESTREDHLELTAGILALTDVDAICDITNEPRLFAEDAAFNQTYFQPWPTDAIPHPNLTGNDLWSDYITATINTVR